MSLRRVLRDFEVNVAFEVEPGQVLVVVGPSGAGKTTILNVVAGLDTPEEGRIALGSRVVFDSAAGVDVQPEHRRVGYVFQDYALFPHLNVFDNVAYGLRARHLPAAAVRSRVQELLDLLRIPHLAEAHPLRLSGGEQQRVALARAVAPAADVLLLDEPLGALDAALRGEIRRELKQILATLGMPAVVVTHDYHDALALGHRILVVDRGHIAQLGSREDLLYHPKSTFVARFTGVNYFAGQAQPRGDGTLDVAIGGTHLQAAGQATGEVAVSFFPSDVMLSTTPPTTSARNVVPGRIAEVVDLGDRLRVHLDGDLPLVAEVTPDAFRELRLGEGAIVYAFFKATAVRVAE